MIRSRRTSILLTRILDPHRYHQPLQQRLLFAQTVQNHQYFVNNTKNTMPKDGLQYLVEDHQMINRFFEDFEKLHQDPVQQKQLIHDMVHEISKHASVEEQFVYPLFEQWLTNGQIIASRNRMDDQVNKEIMNQLLKMEPQRDGPLWTATVRKFITVESEHLREEEVWLDELRKKLSTQDISDLYDTLVKGKESAPIYPHPMAPNKPSTGANILHPISGKIDRIVEKLTGQ